MKRPRAPATFEDHLAHAQAAWGAGRLRDAEQAWAAAERLRPGQPVLRFNRAVALKNLGETAAAASLFREQAHGERRLEVLVHLSEIETLSDREEADLADAARAGEPPVMGAALAYALGRQLERRGLHQEAFAAFELGAGRRRAELGDLPERAEAEEVDSVRRAMTIFSADFMAHHAGAGSSLPTPIFVVGLPRSGTTLVEQILASHAKVQGLGESDALNRTVTGQYPYQTLARTTPDHFQRLANTYLRTQRERGWRNTARFVDKTPSSLFAVGMLHLMFPKAVILHTVREAADTAVSNFTQIYGSGNELSYDLRQIGRQHRRYRRMMDHWNAVLPPKRMIEVRLEDLVAEPEARIRWLVTEAAGLSWDPACLKFHENRRLVTTASAAQVRQPIFTTSTGRWRRHADRLGPLFEALGPYAPKEA